MIHISDLGFGILAPQSRKGRKEPIRKPVFVILRSEATKNLNLQFFSYLNEILRSAQNDIWGVFG